VLIEEVEAADVIVIGTPMYNFTIPSTLKAWIDEILRVGRTMKSTSGGKVGMLRDRPVFIGVASGGIFTGDGANQPDFLTPYLTLALNSIGLKALQFLAIQGTAFLGDDQAALAREKALAAINLTVMGERQAVDVWPAVLSGSGDRIARRPLGWGASRPEVRQGRQLLTCRHHNSPASAGL
jgi:FMN-dependent NADH-azoreductase